MKRNVEYSKRHVRRKIQNEKEKTFSNIEKTMFNLSHAQTPINPQIDVQVDDENNLFFMDKTNHTHPECVNNEEIDLSAIRSPSDIAPFQEPKPSHEDPCDDYFIAIETHTKKPKDFTLSESDAYDDDFCYRYSDSEDSDDESLSCDDNVEVRDFESRDELSDAIKSISKNLTNVIASWTVECNIPRSSITKLLHDINTDVPYLSLPLDSRTILKTPRSTPVFQISGGLYCHFGLKNCVQKIAQDYLFLNVETTHINLLISTDGVPLGKSTVKNLWPILCSENITKKVHIIGVFCGDSKPHDANEFLKTFVDESIDLINEGFTYQDITYTVKVHAIICDVPAKAFILNVKYHSGYESCTKCTIEGEMHNCVCFPGEKGTPRTDEKFKQNVYMDGYQRQESLLNLIPKLGLVSCVPLDPMHLLYLGCTRKLILIWLCAKTMYRLSEAKRDVISNRMLSLKGNITSDFARKPRSLKYIKYFKATEFRLFILYVGVVVIKDVVDPNVYVNFICLHAACRILNCPILSNNEEYVKYAEDLLDKFLSDFQSLYGPSFVSHNFHNLLHLTDDVRKYGKLENFSAMKFETFLFMIKNLIKKGEQPLQQLMRRCAEIEHIKKNQIQKNKNNINLKQAHDHGPLPIASNNLQNYSQYKVLELENFCINCDEKNNYVMTKEKEIVKVVNCIQTADNEVYVLGKRIKKLGALYSVPISSSELGIDIVSGEEGTNLELWTAQSINAKLLRLPFGEDYVTFVILHMSQD